MRVIPEIVQFSGHFPFRTDQAPRTLTEMGKVAFQVGLG